MKVSVFKKITDTTGGIDCDIEEILSKIRDGHWQDMVLDIRIEQNKELRTKLKSKLPYFTVCGTFKQRRNDSLVHASGLIAIDFDEVENIQMYTNLLRDDKYTFASFRSVSGRGICCIVKINPEKHKESFEGLANYYFSLLKIPIDPACKDVSRPRYISYDPDLYHNPNSATFKEYPVKEKKHSSHSYIHTKSKFDFVMSQINTDITGTYSDWVKIGFAIASQFGPDGADYFHHISSFGPTYDHAICEKQYKYCLRKGDITIGTFYYYAKLHGYQLSDPTQAHIEKVATYAKKGGRDKSSVVENLSLSGVPVNEEIIDAVFSQPATTEEDTKSLNIEDVEIWLRHYQIKKNEVTRFYEYKGKQITQEQLNSIFLACKKQFSKISREIFDTILFSEFTPTYNPIKLYLQSLVWDGKDRLLELTDSITSDTGTLSYRCALMQSWLLGIIESIYIDEPNVLQMIFAGKQNTGKSYFFKKLLPKPLQHYTAFSQLDKGKDDELLMCQKLLIIDDEYSGKSKMDAKLIKRLLSAHTFDLREPYGKSNITVNRIATLCASTNETQILNDPTGNRRNIIFEVTGKFNYALYNSIDKEQLFAQLYDLHKSGVTAQLTDATISQIHDYTADRHFEISHEAECIAMRFYPPDEATDYDFRTATEIKNIIETHSVQRVLLKKLGMELKRLGYNRIKRGPIYGYLIKQIG